MISIQLRARLAAIATLGLLLNTSCGGDKPMKPTPPPPPTPRTSGILFEDDADQGIYVMDADGSDPLGLSNGHSDAQPAWSPGGTRIAFSRFYPDPSGGIGELDIAVMNYDGASVVRLTTTVGEDVQPRWSPDGLKIAFMHIERTLNLYAICVMDSNGTGRVQLTPAGKLDYLPQRSPDGTKIAFWNLTDSVRLYTMDRPEVTASGS